MRARVYRSAQREFYCKLLDSAIMVNACAFGNLLKGDETVVVGDYVKIEQSDGKDEYVIVEVEPRTSEIYRMLIREQKKKVTAANCDVLVILTSVSKPEYKRGVVDRFLLRAQQWGITPILVFNKMDEFCEGEVDIRFESDRLKNLGVKCFEISAKYPDYAVRYLNDGIGELKKYLATKTSIFMGHSGVGKSKAISCLGGEDIKLRTREVGREGKGTHTTTWSEIVEVGDILMIDSPGIRSFAINDLYIDNILSYFPDIAPYILRCKFFDCLHDESAKGCAFYEELDVNSYEGRLILSRLESYRKFHEEISQIPEWQKK